MMYWSILGIWAVWVVMVYVCIFSIFPTVHDRPTMHIPQRAGGDVTVVLAPGLLPDNSGSIAHMDAGADQENNRRPLLRLYQLLLEIVQLAADLRHPGNNTTNKINGL
jgi:hypothetical protein